VLLVDKYVQESMAHIEGTCDEETCEFCKMESDTLIEDHYREKKNLVGKYERQLKSRRG